MKTLKFKCILLSDIVLSEHSATEGIQKTLDYIPGNVFLGIVAGQLYQKMKDSNKAILLFHSGKVRFGDAHPLIGNKKRAIRVPSSWHIEKGDRLDKSPLYIHPFKCNNPTSQCRSEFIVKSDEKFFDIFKQKKNFAIKSAYDKNLRRSKDQQMYGYQSLETGTELCFQLDFVNTESESIIEDVRLCLIEKHTIGRSKTAQYGQIEISEADFKIGFAEDLTTELGYTLLYAESRLLFIDENGQPFIPMDGNLYGLNKAKVVLEKSQIRTFRYSPYNSKRQTRDADRFGIEKGSVICIDRNIESEEIQTIKNGLGQFQNEGFGKVLINPEFLNHKDDMGKSVFSYQHLVTNPKVKSPNKDSEEKINRLIDEQVLKYLQKASKAEDEQRKTYEEVNKFITANKNIFIEKGVQFSSQWGTIRMKALQSNNKVELGNALFSAVQGQEGFLLRGHSAQKWSENGRLRMLEKFFNELEKSTALKTMINLSTEMAKICQKKGDKK